MNSHNTQLAKKLLPLALFAFIISIAVWFTYGRSRLTFSYDGPGELQVHIYNQVSEEGRTYSISDTLVLQIKKSDYEVTATNENGSYFTLVKTGNFLRNSKIKVKLSAQNQGDFIATDPSICGYFTTIYVSYDCFSGASTLASHRKGTAQNPSYAVANIKNKPLGTMSNVIPIGSEAYTVIQDSSARAVGRNSLYELIPDDNGDYLKFTRNLDSLNSTVLYSISAYKDGFIAYDQKLEDVYFYSSATSEAEYVKTGIPAEFDAYANGTADVKGDTILFSKNNLGDTTTTDKQTVFSVFKIGSEAQIYTTSSALSKATMCSENTICGISKKNLSIYEIVAKKLEKIDEIKNVDNYEIGRNNVIYIVKDDAIYSFDIVTKTGYLMYSPGGFQTSNIITDGDSLIVYISSRDISVAVRIDKTTKSNNTIFALLQKLSESELVSSYSVYGDTIYLLPDLGDPVYLETEGYFGYDQLITDEIKAQINNLIDVSGGTGSYKVSYLL
jgi:hypothetical protein